MGDSNRKALFLLEYAQMQGVLTLCCAVLWGVKMEDDENAGIDWAKIGITVLAGLVIVAIIGAAVLYLATGKLEFPSFAPSIQPQAAVNGYDVSLSWSPVSGASSYSIYRSQKAGDIGIAIAKNVTAAKYIDTPDTDGTYYYSVKYVVSGAEDGKTLQASATVGKKQLPALGPVTLVIANGAGVTGTRDVALSTLAANATSCRFWQDGAAKGEFTTSFQSQKITLAGADGNITVNAECRNAESGRAETANASASITLDTTAPSIEIISSSIPFNAENFTVKFRPSDAVSSTVNCTGVQNGIVYGYDPYKSGMNVEFDFAGIGSQAVNNVSIVCMDEVGNIAVSKNFTFTTPVENVTAPVRANVKYSPPQVTSRNIELTVYADDNASKCRFKNDDNAWSDWSGFVSARQPNEYQWTIGGQYGKRAVYIECANDTASVGIANVTIIYAQPGTF